MVSTVTVETSDLGDRSYLVHDGSVAIVIDPQRDIDRVLEIAKREGVAISLVLETHLHNDYVTGGLELSQREGATYVVGGGEEATYCCTPARDGDTYTAGSMTVRVLATPGHTHGHVAYVLEEAGRPTEVFTGGSLLFGTVGRTDLVSVADTDGLTRAQHRSARRLVDELPAEVVVRPTHGFGSFCSSASSSGASSSTIGDEAVGNFAITVEDEDTFVKTLLAGLAAYPSYYAHMGLINRAGPAPLDLSPPALVSKEELLNRIRRGEWVVDLRSRRAYAGGHLAGTLGIELGSLFSTYLGWVHPRGMPITLLGESADQVAEAQRQLARIGIDRPSGMAVGQPEEFADSPLQSYPVVGFADLAGEITSASPPIILDVRRNDEWALGHIEGAIHIPIHEIPARLDELPDGEIVVHCAAGFRASVAASLLHRSGQAIILVDDDFSHAAEEGIPVTVAAH
jgi:hydroxyacylglutathione hydrolase